MDSPAAGIWSVGKPYWEASARFEDLGEFGVASENSVGSGCIKSGARRGERKGDWARGSLVSL